MKRSRLFAATLVAVLAAVGLSACEKKNEGAGPAETAGRQIDQAAAKTNEKLEQAGEKISEDTSEFRKKVGEKMEQAGEKIQKAADKDADK
jgi:cell division protein ZapA (FtsZ GTPase activity inhibitor)